MNELITPQEAKHLEIVSKVLNLVGDGCRSIAEACMVADIPKETFYWILRQPHAQRWLVARYQATLAATFQILESNWLQIVANLIELACGRGPTAVSAAKLLFEIKRSLKEELVQADQAGAESGPSPARLILDGFQRPRALRRRIVEETIELERGSESEV